MPARSFVAAALSVLACVAPAAAGTSNAPVHVTMEVVTSAVIHVPDQIPLDANGIPHLSIENVLSVRGDAMSAAKLALESESSKGFYAATINF
jgi:hypothetical protein